MSRATHLASMIRRPIRERSAVPETGSRIIERSSRAAIAIRHVGEVVITLSAIFLVVGAVTAFKVWMWWPHIH